MPHPGVKGIRASQTHGNYWLSLSLGVLAIGPSGSHTLGMHSTPRYTRSPHFSLETLSSGCTGGARACDPPASASRGAGVTGIHPHTLPRRYFCNFCKSKAHSKYSVKHEALWAQWEGSSPGLPPLPSTVPAGARLLPSLARGLRRTEADQTLPGPPGHCQLLNHSPGAAGGKGWDPKLSHPGMARWTREPGGPGTGPETRAQPAASPSPKVNRKLGPAPACW